MTQKATRELKERVSNVTSSYRVKVLCEIRESKEDEGFLSGGSSGGMKVLRSEICAETRSKGLWPLNINKCGV